MNINRNRVSNSHNSASSNAKIYKKNIEIREQQLATEHDVCVQLCYKRENQYESNPSDRKSPSHLALKPHSRKCGVLSAFSKRSNTTSAISCLSVKSRPIKLSKKVTRSSSGSSEEYILTSASPNLAIMSTVHAVDATPLPKIRREHPEKSQASLDQHYGTKRVQSSSASPMESIFSNKHSQQSINFTPDGTIDSGVPTGATSRPTSTESTAASVKDLDHEKAEALSFSLTPSTSDSIRAPRQREEEKKDLDTLKRSKILFKRRPKAIYFLLPLTPIVLFYFVYLIVGDFASGRCWSSLNFTSSSAAEAALQTQVVTSPENLATASQSVVICTDDSLFRWVPSCIRFHLRIQMQKSKSSLPKKLRFPTRAASRLVKHLIFQAVELYRILSIPQQLSRFLHYLANCIDIADNLASTGAHHSSDVHTLQDLKRRVNEFEASGIIEHQMENSTQSIALRKHNDEFRKRIDNVLDNVYVAHGYGLANVIIIDTLQGLILFDTLENPSGMRHLMEDWIHLKRDEYKALNITMNSKEHKWGRPIIAIVYSHFHSDHVFGASEIYEEGLTQIWAHEKTDQEISKLFTVTAGTTYKRSMRQFGTLLSDEDGFINAGIGLRLDYDASDTASAIRPTHVWAGDHKTIKIGGETLELIHAPGESRDQSIVWLPKKRLLFGADNIYKSLPNIYAIRGTESRDAMIWVKSLDTMRALRPAVLVLGHTSTLYGETFIWDTITAYRDAIQFIHDQTVRHMNKGRSINEIVEIIQLPSHLHHHPYLQPYYGTVSWAVRAVFHHYVGWFSSRPEDLHTMTSIDRATKMAELVGGRLQLLARAIDSLEEGNYQWALELITYTQLLSPKCETTRRIKTSILKILATTQTSAPGRNWYLTAARESEDEGETMRPKRVKLFLSERWKRLRGFFGHDKLHSGFSTKRRRPAIAEQLKVTRTQKNQCIKNLKSAIDIFSFIPPRMRAEAALNVIAILSFMFTDTNATACIHFRKGIAYVANLCETSPDLSVITTEDTWRRIITYELNPLVAITTRKLKIKSNDPLDYLRLRRLLGLVEIDME